MRHKLPIGLLAFAAISLTGFDASAVKMQNLQFFEVVGPMAPWGQGDYVPFADDLGTCVPGTSTIFPVKAYGYAYDKYGNLVATNWVGPWEGEYEWQVPNNSRGFEAELVVDQVAGPVLCSTYQATSWSGSVVCYDWTYFRVGSWTEPCTQRAIRIKSKAWIE